MTTHATSTAAVGVRSLVGVGLLTAAVGAAFASRISLWIARDMGLTGTGAWLRDPVRASSAAVFPIAAATVGAIVAVGARRWARWRPLHQTMLVAMALCLTGLAAASITWYPRASYARVVALDASGDIAWTTSTPATQLFGLRSRTDAEVVVEGRVDHRDCGFEFVAITIDRQTGAIREVRTLPQSSASPADVPVPPERPGPSEFRFDHGRQAVACNG